MRAYSLDEFRANIQAIGRMLERRPTAKGPILHRILTSYEFIQKVDRLIERLSPEERMNPGSLTHERVASLLADTPITPEDVRSFRLVFKLFNRISRRKASSHRPCVSASADLPPALVDVDTSGLVTSIESEFGVTIPDIEAEGIDGSFDSIVRFLAVRVPD
jgi:hypothetical protein